MKDGPFHQQARLMLRILPAVVGEKAFALKGGTAINFFVRDMPRLSVDIDLTYIPQQPRAEALQGIQDSLERVAATIQKSLPQASIQRSHDPGSGQVMRLFIRNGVTVKIEPNTVLRGSVFPVVERDLMPSAQDLFEMAVTVQMMSLPDLYGGKLVAALDRQHPRDLFDVKLLMENEGIDDRIRKAFVIYLASHNRPIHEAINPTRLDQRKMFEQEFAGMSAIPVTYDELNDVREKLISTMNTSLTQNEKLFLLSVKRGEPDYPLMDLPGIENLSGLQWKIQNVRQMAPEKHARMLARLRDVLGL